MIVLVRIRASRSELPGLNSLSSLFVDLPAPAVTMCYREIRGDLYRGCQPIQHFQRTDYAPGPIIDCNSPYCAVSNAHTHTSPCNCSQRIAIRERIVNQFYTICDNCKRIELDRRVGRR
ncbi:hypothetical protein LENED_012249 [Lentinula edodes]|uniref:Uncharacterized protein n=1 Tax=Lentinula edodes TaxID=5353 RepID=A0A1Q3ES42_LENED|nr:hypothetical protein LENED_012249 [Lentinula edodes]